MAGGNVSPFPKDPGVIDLDSVPLLTGIVPKDETPILVEVKDDGDAESSAWHGCHVAQVLCERRTPKCPICSFRVRWRSRMTPAQIPWAFWREDERRIEVTHAECVKAYLFEHGAHTAFPIGKLGHDFRERWTSILWNVPDDTAAPEDTALVVQRA